MLGEGGGDVGARDDARLALRGDGVRRCSYSLSLIACIGNEATWAVELAVCRTTGAQRCEESKKGIERAEEGAPAWRACRAQRTRQPPPPARAHSSAINPTGSPASRPIPPSHQPLAEQPPLPARAPC